MEKNEQLLEEREERREEKEAVPKKQRPDAAGKLGRLKRRLIALAVVLVASLLAIGFIWSRGKKQGEAKAEAEIAALQEQMAQQADQIK